MAALGGAHTRNLCLGVWKRLFIVSVTDWSMLEADTAARGIAKHIIGSIHSHLHGQVTGDNWPSELQSLKRCGKQSYLWYVHQGVWKSFAYVAN